jgi:WD40 repeat protein
VKIWNFETRRLQRTLTGHKRAVLSVDISSDGRFIAAGSGDRTARIWDATAGDELLVLQHAWYPNKVQFSPDGTLLATSEAKGKIRFWDVDTGIELAIFDVTNCFVSGFSWSPTGRHLAIACTPYLEDGNTISSQTKGSIRLCDVTNTPNGVSVHERKALNGDYHPSDITFSSNGKFIADARHVATIWRAPAGKEVAIIRQQWSTSGGERVKMAPNGKIMALGSGRAIRLWDISALETADDEK